MDFVEAVRVSAKKYLEGRLEMPNTEGLEGDKPMFTLEFFDDLEEKLLRDPIKDEELLDED